MAHGRIILSEWMGRIVVGWPAPTDSISAVRKAGKRIRHGQETPDDIVVLNRWRAAHGYIINTFQANLRTRARSAHIPVAQRLKRANTIIDKLRQGRSVDLATMHDIAGVRMVFPDVATLVDFRTAQHTTRAKHELQSPPDRYDYIQNPKDSGYRGIHDVYMYKAGSQSGALWNDLRIEIQYRTLVQHAWATAVELSDALRLTRTKFSQGPDDSQRFFVLCSELLAREFEGRSSCLPDVCSASVLDEWREIEDRCHFLQQLKSVSAEGAQGILTGFVLLIVQPDGKLDVERKRSYRDAVESLIKVEAEHPEWDVVLASGDRDESLRSAFRNYFRNSTEFVRMMEKALAAV